MLGFASLGLFGTAAFSQDPGAQDAPAYSGLDDAQAAEALAQLQPFLDQNCATCHSPRAKRGGLVLQNLADLPLGESAGIWEKVVRKLAAGEMPPPAVKRRPDPHAVAAFSSEVIAILDAYAERSAQAGRPVIRRLTRTEYSNAVRDLLALDVDAGASLPPDTTVYGFDNNGDALSLSSLLLDKYMNAASRVSRMAVGDTSIPPSAIVYATPEGQSAWRKGFPIGSRGGPVIDHYFPLDAEYTVRLYLDMGRLDEVFGTRVLETRARVEAGSRTLTIGAPEANAIAEGPIRNLDGLAGRRGGPLDPSITATPRPVLDVRIDGKLVERIEVAGTSPIDLATPNSVMTGLPWVRRVEIGGPYEIVGPGKTPSRQKVFVCEPDKAGDERGCANRIIATTLRRAYRRDVSADDAAPFIALYDKMRRDRDFEGSIQAVLNAILVSPGFLFRVERDPADLDAGDQYTLDDFALASRLSFMIWSSIPDDRLLDLASAGKLSDPRILKQEARRMLDDPRSIAMVDNFGKQFLGLGDILSMEVDRNAYQEFNRTLIEDFWTETRLFLSSVLQGNKSVTELVGADYTYLNETLATLYGVEGVKGPAFRKVSFEPDSPRGGILGQGSVMLVTSHPNITSPVLRGKWVLSSLLAQPPAPPPPGVPPLSEETETGERLTGRQQMEMHRTSPVCSSCHARMDPFGFALENFDVLGRWRVEDEGGTVDPLATMPDGATFNGVVGLRNVLLEREEELAHAVTYRLMSYALGRRLDGTDEAVVRAIVNGAASDGYRFNDLLLGVIDSVPFRMRRKAEEA